MSLGSDDDLCLDNPLMHCVEASESSSVVVEIDRREYVPPFESNNFTGFGSLDDLAMTEGDQIARRRFRRSSLPIKRRQGAKSGAFADLPAAKSTVKQQRKHVNAFVPRNDEAPVIDVTRLKLTDEPFWQKVGDKVGFFEAVCGYFRVSEYNAKSNFPQKLWNAVQISDNGLSKWLGVRFVDDVLVEFEPEKFSRVLGMDGDSSLWTRLLACGFTELCHADVVARDASLADRCNVGCHYFQHPRNLFSRKSTGTDLEQIRTEMIEM